MHICMIPQSAYLLSDTDVAAESRCSSAVLLPMEKELKAAEYERSILSSTLLQDAYLLRRCDPMVVVAAMPVVHLVCRKSQRSRRRPKHRLPD